MNCSAVRYLNPSNVSLDNIFMPFSILHDQVSPSKLANNAPSSTGNLLPMGRSMNLMANIAANE